MSWDIVKLDSIFDISRGGSPRPINDYLTDDIDGINWIMIGDTESGQKYINSTAKKIKKEGVSKSRAVHKGDFLLTNSMSFGRPYILNIDGCIHDGWLVLSPINENLSKDYFYFYLGSNEIKSRLASMAAGAVVKNLNKDLVKSLKIPFPPLEEQKKIAAILDAADAYRQKTKALIDKYDQLTQSLFLDMFGDLRKYPKEAMKDAVNFIDYRGKSPNKVDSGIPLLTAKNVKVGYISEEPKEYIPVEEYEEWMVRGFPKTGNVLFTTEAPLGQAAILPHYEKVAIAQRLICFQPNESLEPNYLLHTILSPLFQAELNRRATGSTAKGIRSKELAKIEIPIPPLHVQKEFNKRVQALKAQKEQAQASLAKAEDLFNSLLQKAFKGELTN